MYLLKTSVLILLFYLFYKVFLEKETFFTQNRWFLIFGIFAAFTIPLVTIPIYVTANTSYFSEFVVVGTTSEVVTNSISIFLVVKYLYLSGLVFFGIKLCIELVALVTIIRNGKQRRHRKFIFIETTKETAPFSFFKWIVYNKNQFNKEELQQIITHEKIHVNQKHSLDHLLIQITSVALWFNPFIWLYKKALLQNLEFIADSLTQQQLKNKKSYQRLLLKTSLNNTQLAVATNFYTSIIKKRILMLHKTNSNKTKQWIYLAILPVLAIFMMSFNTKTITENNLTLTILKNDTTRLMITKDTKESEFNHFIEVLSNKGVTAKFNNIKRNKKGEIIGIQISLKSKHASSSYSVKSDKTISPIRINIKENGKHISILASNRIMKTQYFSAKNKTYVLSESDDANNIIILKAHKNGESNTSEVIEIEELDAEGNKVIAINKSKKVMVFTSDKENSPLFLLEGKEITTKEMSEIKSHLIENMSILKGEEALKKYGERGKNGVIEVTLKK